MPTCLPPVAPRGVAAAVERPVSALQALPGRSPPWLRVPLQRRRRRRGRSRGGARGRIEQQRVFTHQPAGRPGGLDDHVDKGFQQRAVTADTDHRAAIGQPLQRHLCAAQGRVVVDAGGAVGLGRRHTQAQRCRLFVGDAGDVDFSAQRFTEPRLHVDASQSQSPGRRHPQAGGGERHPGQRKAPSIHRADFQRRLPKRSASSRGETRRERRPVTTADRTFGNGGNHNNIKHIG